MNAKIKKLFIGVLLFILQPAAMAEHYYYDYVKNYSNCSIKMSGDDKVEVGYTVNLAPDFDRATPENIIQWNKLINIPDEDLKNASLDPDNPLILIYAYNTDGSKIEITTQDVHNASVQNRTHGVYRILFTLNLNTLNRNIRVAAGIGHTLKSANKQQYPLHSLKGISFGPSGDQCEPFDYQANIAPQPLKVDPEFRLASAFWQFIDVDLDRLLDSGATGLRILPRKSSTDSFCITYRTVGIQNTRYMISANNSNGLSADGKYFQFKRKEKTINYRLILSGNNGQYSPYLPLSKSFMLLENGNSNTKQMCWSPEINLFSTDTTDKGFYSDTLNFTITPEA
ncbi:alpha-related fimbriae major subunit [Yersinia thracica]|uniref:Alpha-related fimbriae major subunit n=1 Tax=Yersinia thracica TaxID=2890319 RepID=A0A0T9Q6Y2_9GAMM|nr:hypothetical protein [Yersinia thracica]CNH97332.1 alpha-related fimbriae major subunit [Yersinia thracica]